MIHYFQQIYFIVVDIDLLDKKRFDIIKAFLVHVSIVLYIRFNDSYIKNELVYFLRVSISKILDWIHCLKLIFEKG